MASLLTAAALAGCGPLGDDGEGMLSEEELVTQGDEICRSAQERVAEVQRDPPEGRQESIRFAEALIAVFEDEVGELEALDPPEDKRRALERYLGARAEAIGFLREGLDAAEADDPQAYGDAQADVAAGQVKRAELAQEVGFRECSRALPGGTPAPGE